MCIKWNVVCKMYSEAHAEFVSSAPDMACVQYTVKTTKDITSKQVSNRG